MTSCDRYYPVNMENGRYGIVYKNTRDLNSEVVFRLLMVGMKSLEDVREQCRVLNYESKIKQQRLLRKPKKVVVKEEV